jgi:hypothetical protein
VALLEEMLSVGCTPPRRMFVRVVQALCGHPSTFEAALQVSPSLFTSDDPIVTVVREWIYTLCSYIYFELGLNLFVHRRDQFGVPDVYL